MRDLENYQRRFRNQWFSIAGVPLPWHAVLQRSLAHCYETGAMRRLYLRGRENVWKRQLIHIGAFNLTLVFRQR
jgi:hypothetical protein